MEYILQLKDIKWLHGLKKKQDPVICCQEQTHFYEETQEVKVKGWIKLLLASGNQKGTGVAMLM